MATQLTETATEGSTFAVQVAFTNEDGDAVTPSAITWTLTDLAGTVVNSRSDVSVGSPASTINIVLSGNDLLLTGYVGEVRVLTVEATYTSALGSGLPLKEAARFMIEPLVAV
jgi:hypothetical protein